MATNDSDPMPNRPICHHVCSLEEVFLRAVEVLLAVLLFIAAR